VDRNFAFLGSRDKRHPLAPPVPAHTGLPWRLHAPPPGRRDTSRGRLVRRGAAPSTEPDFRPDLTVPDVTSTRTVTPTPGFPGGCRSDFRHALLRGEIDVFQRGKALLTELTRTRRRGRSRLAQWLRQVSPEGKSHPLEGAPPRHPSVLRGKKLLSPRQKPLLWGA